MLRLEFLEKTVLPLDFEVRENGIYFKGYHISSPIVVLARAYEGTKFYGLLLSFKDKNNCEHFNIIPLSWFSYSSMNLCAFLLSHGLPYLSFNMKHKSKLSKYLLTCGW